MTEPYKGDKKVLVLGAGTSRVMRIGLYEGTQVPAKPWTFDEAFKKENIWTVDINPKCSPRIVHNLEDFPWPVPTNYFDEVHAYEVLEHLGQLGDYEFFFKLWRQIWHVLKPQGVVAASTPWWESLWAWQDPGHRRVYSPDILVYLNQAEYAKQVGNTSMTDYREPHWRPPYNFETRFFEMTSDEEPKDPKRAGFSFVLQKEEWKGEDSH
jgi:SAM-dependent methyltransferase